MLPTSIQPQLKSSGGSVLAKSSKFLVNNDVFSMTMTPRFMITMAFNTVTAEIVMDTSVMRDINVKHNTVTV